MNRLMFFALGLIACFSSCDAANQEVENQLSLNGTWKFYTIYGEGANYMNVHEEESDLVIDNNSPNVKVQGKWGTSKEGRFGPSYVGEDYLQHWFSQTDLNNDNKTDSSSVRFYPDLKKSGYYEVFVTYPYVSHMTAQHNVHHDNEVTTKYLNQRLFSGEWNSLGIYKFNPGNKNYVEVTAIVSGQVAADAIMFKEISKEKYLKAREEPTQVYKTEFDDSHWYDLSVPGHWGMINEFSNYTGIGWYRKTIDLPKDWKKGSDDRYYIKFGGVYHLTKVYVNGKFVGRNRGGFTPFEFDITDVLNYEGENVIAVQADNSAIISATWNWGGIIRDVSLTKNKDVKIDYQYIHAIPNLKTGSADIKLKVRVENNSNKKRTIDVHSVLIDKKKIGELKGSLEIEANSVKDIKLETTLSSKVVELWHFDNPKLYSVETAISEGKEELNKLKDHFGIRKVELTDSKMLLNGEAVRLAGYNRVSESRYWGSSEPFHVLEEDVDLMKESGANFMRIMHGTQNEKLMELCDRKGIMIFEEINVRDLDNDEFRANYYPVAKLEAEKGIKLNPEEEEILMLDEPYVMLTDKHGIEVKEKNYLLAKYWLKGMIERDINHPSIIGWSVGNELNNHFDYGKEAIAYVKNELDPYRFAVCVSNSGQKKEYTPETDANTHGDLIMHNMYTWQGEPQEILNTLRKKWPKKAIFISEFGFGPFPSTGQDVDDPTISTWTNDFIRHNNEYVIGTSVWTFNDYRSAYGGTTAEENRVWGVINTWRQKRKLFDRLKIEYAPILDIEVTDIDFNSNTAKLTIPIRNLTDFPSYTIKDYKLVYKFRNTKGEVISTNSIDLPTLTPGEEAWKGSVSWKELPSEVLDLTLDLISPTNYSRFDKTISFKQAITPKIKEVIAGKNSARVIFEQVPNATEYFVKYSGNGIQEKLSDSTIGSFIDIDSLETGETYGFELYAINDKANSKPSNKVSATTGTNDLPPVIWDTFITNNKLVIGYSCDFTDGNYTVKYGTSKDNLDKEFVTNVRGMLSIDINGECEVFFKIKRTTPDGESNWSNIMKAEKK